MLLLPLSLLFAGAGSAFVSVLRGSGFVAASRYVDGARSAADTTAACAPHRGLVRSTEV
jgi:hypothetical protein